jgi:Protein of unknown function (DUF2510)
MSYPPGPAPDGWYPDPSGQPASERWYSAGQWSEYIRPAPTPEAAFGSYGGPGVPVAPLAPAPPTSAGRKKLVTIVAAAGALVLLLAVVIAGVLGGSSDGTRKTTVTGTFVLTDADTAAAGCVGTGGYTDITQGTTVILTNESGTILGSAALDAGTADTTAGTCTYHFAVPGVPENQSQYAVEVAHRGKVVNSRADMQASGWTFALTLGS